MTNSHKSFPLLLSLTITTLSLISYVQSYNNDGATVDLIHRDSPLAPHHDPSTTRYQRLRNAFDRSFTRKSSLLSITSSNDAPLRSAGGEYLIEYQIGTPPVRQLSIADTGSDLIWIQCQPCTSCYKQDYPLFDPAASKSYKPFSCQSPQCASAGSGGDKGGCSGSNVCQYEVGYGDSSYSLGDLAAETLTLGANATFPNFIFGCSKESGGTFRPSGSGIFGLGNGAVSIVNQDKTSIGGRFSYCLTPLDSNVPSKISFGSDAVVTGPNVVSTPLVSKIPSTFYYLILDGFSVGEQRLDVNGQDDPSDFDGNIIIDSGTTLTFAPSEIYRELENALVKAISGKRVYDPQQTFNLCYEAVGGQLGSPVPQITLHFKGADVVLPEKSVFLEVEKGLVCLTVLPSQGGVSIFGNLHQVDYLVGYDLVKKQVNFLKTDCTKPR